MAYFKSYGKSYGGLGWLATGPVRKGNKDFPRGKITHQSEITYRGKFRIITNSRYIKYCKKKKKKSNISLCKFSLLYSDY